MCYCYISYVKLHKESCNFNELLFLHHNKINFIQNFILYNTIYIIIKFIFQFQVPKSCQENPCFLGVDEAGRGPVLGPMVYGICYAPLSEDQLLVDLGCADSKSLTEEKRDEIFDKICEQPEKMGWAVDVISPNYISTSMTRRTKVSLNEVSMNSAIALIKKTIDAGAFIREIYVDTVGKPEKYQAKLEAIFPGLKIVVAKKADSTFPIVSAASICAKVSRDHAIRAWKFREGEIGMEFGSGYPNDPATKSWLTENIDRVFGFPHLVRFSWSTADVIMEKDSLEVEWEEVEDGKPKAKNQKISKFFSKPAGTDLKHQRKHNYFKDCFLDNALDL